MDRMGLNGELFECKSCGFKEHKTADSILNDNNKEPYIPFYALMCKACGKEGRYICKGNLIGLCKVIDNWCEYHNCGVF